MGPRRALHPTIPKENLRSTTSRQSPHGHVPDLCPESEILQNNVDFAELARRTEGYSGGDIRDLFQSTQIKVVRDFFQRGAANDLNAIPDPITMEDFETIIIGRRPSVSQNIIKRYYDWDESFKAS